MPQAPKYTEDAGNIFKLKAIIKGLSQDDFFLKTRGIDTLFQKYKASSDDSLLWNIYERVKYLSVEPYEIGENAQMWNFNIRNDGRKPAEQIYLEVPFKGEYKIYLPGNKTLTAQFDKRIEIGDLTPGYEIGVTCWVRDTYSPLIVEDQEKTRVTHKYGVVAIQYPVEATGSAAWLIKHDFSIKLLLAGIIWSFLAVWGEKYFAKFYRFINSKFKKKHPSDSQDS